MVRINSLRFKKGENKTTKSFFFTKISEDLGAKEMYEIFSEYGIFDEVVIPPRKDIRGMRFDFVCFFDVQQPARMVVKLDNIFLGRKKIHVNISRFTRGQQPTTNNQRRFHNETLGRNQKK